MGWADNMRSGDVRRAMRLITEQQVSLLALGETSMNELTVGETDPALARGKPALRRCRRPTGDQRLSHVSPITHR